MYGTGSLLGSSWLVLILLKVYEEMRNIYIRNRNSKKVIVIIIVIVIVIVIVIAIVNTFIY